jgi:ABC-type lipoprotein export system ATPase subunit
MHQGDIIIEARGLWKSFDRGRIPVIQGASLHVRRGEMVALWGTSGSGKSTLLHLLSGLDVPDSGTVTVCGMDAKLEANRLQLRRRHLGFVFQLHHLIPDLTLDENLRLPALAAHANPKKTLARIEQLTSEVGLSHRRGHRIQDLSGGERQRTAICRALMNHPELIFADEPTGSLDEETGWIIFELLGRLVKQEQVAVVLATHERRFVEHCDRVLRVQQGKLVAA